MTRTPLIYHLAMAASRDAGNRHAREHGRKAWNVDDWNEAVRVFNVLYPVEEQETSP